MPLSADPDTFNSLDLGSLLRLPGKVRALHVCDAVRYRPDAALF